MDLASCQLKIPFVLSRNQMKLTAALVQLPGVVKVIVQPLHKARLVVLCTIGFWYVTFVIIKGHHVHTLSLWQVCNGGDDYLTSDVTLSNKRDCGDGVVEGKLSKVLQHRYWKVSFFCWNQLSIGASGGIVFQVLKLVGSLCSFKVGCRIRIEGIRVQFHQADYVLNFTFDDLSEEGRALLGKMRDCKMEELERRD